MSIVGLVFDYGWRKPMDFYFNNKNYRIELVFNAYAEEELSLAQRGAYADFLQKQNTFETRAMSLLRSFIEENQIDCPSVVPKELYFQYDGTFALLCDCSWDEEHGIAIILSDIGEVVTQDVFL